MKLLITIALVLVLTGCTQYLREVYIYVEDGGTLTIGDIEILAEWKKRDENQTNSPEDTLKLPEVLP